jgi:hypothetical protein
MAQNPRDYWIVTTIVDYADGAGAQTVGEIPAGEAYGILHRVDVGNVA